MPKDLINGIQLYWEIAGESGDPLVCVHGAFVDHNHWQFLTPLLAGSFRVLTYDRRGHSLSQRPSAPATLTDHVADLAALLEHLHLAPAHIVGHSYGGLVVLRLAAEQPQLFRTMLLHEPFVPDLNQETAANELVATLLKEGEAAAALMASGQLEAGARHFVASGFGPDVWNQLLEDTRKLLVLNAPAFVDQVHDPEPLSVDPAKLAAFDRPTLLSQGELSPPVEKVMAHQLEEQMPWAQAQVMPAAGHSPHVSHPQEYAALIRYFISSAT